MKKKQGKKWLYIYIGIFILSIGIIVLNNSCRGKQSFSSEEWIMGEDMERYRMLDSLEQNYNLTGMSVEEIQTLLGEYSIQCDAYLSDSETVDYHWGYFIRDDAWEGIEVFLIGFKDDCAVNYDRVYLSEL